MSTAPKATAVLRDVFRLTNRGTVLVIGPFEGDIEMGDRITMHDRETHVIGLEALDAPAGDGAKSKVGILIHDIDDEILRGFIGKPMSFYRKA